MPGFAHQLSIADRDGGDTEESKNIQSSTAEAQGHLEVALLKCHLEEEGLKISFAILRPPLRIDLPEILPDAVEIINRLRVATQLDIQWLFTLL